ncbi:MAG TPA: ATP-binding protein [Bacteroidia bacterium]|jgi:light-regulated signal transduction histidine kinase (bacteriophytochrome)
MTSNDNKTFIEQANELIKVNEELAFQNSEKEKRASELHLANRELLYQNEEKEKRAAELIIANKELLFQNEEKEKRAAELKIANIELAYQNEEKEKRAAELVLINKELSSQKKQLEDFCNIISHNLRAPLVNISMLVDFITESNDEAEQLLLREKLTIASNNLNEVFNELVESLQVKQDLDIISEKLSFQEYLYKACDGLQGQISKSQAIIDVDFNDAPLVNFPDQYLKSIFHNFISNSLKYQFPGRQLIIKVKTTRKNQSIILSVEDNGLGIDLARHTDNLFKIRKVFHLHPDAKGFGLFITKTQVEALGGKIWAESVVDVGSTFFVEFVNQS